TYYGQRPEPRPSSLWQPLSCVLGLSVLVTAWPWLLNRLLNKHANPFTLFEVGPPVAALLATSAAVTALYFLYTWFTYHLARLLPDLAVVRFFARNTLIIFIVHMPIFYDFGIRDRTDQWTSYSLARLGLRLLFCLVLPAVASETIFRLVRPKVLRDWLWRLCV